MQAAEQSSDPYHVSRAVSAGEGRWYREIEKRSRIIMAVHIVAMMYLVFGFLFLPIGDYPDWLYQGYIFNQYVFHGNDFGGAFIMHPYIPPNAISTVLIGTLGEIIHPFHAGRVFLALSMLAVYFGVYFFMGITLKGNRALRAIIAFTFVFSYNFWLGNINFLMGLGVALLGAWLLIERGWIEKIIPAAAVILLCYLCHFFSLAILGLAVLGFIISGRRFNLIGKLAIAALPAAALFIHYVINADVATGDENIVLTLFQNIRARAAMFAGVVIPFQRFRHVTEPGTFHKIINYSYLAGIALLVLLAAYGLFRDRRPGLNGLLALPLFLLIFLLPLYTSGIVYPGERLVIFFMVNLLGFLVLNRPSLKYIILPAYVFMNVAVGWSAYYNTSYFNQLLGMDTPPGPRQQDVQEAPSGSGGIDPYNRYTYYWRIPAPGYGESPQLNNPLPIFESGLFRRADSKIDSDK